MPKVRCMGSSHSWSHHFADDGAWMVDTSGINHLEWSADQPKQVGIPHDGGNKLQDRDTLLCLYHVFVATAPYLDSLVLVNARVH